MIDSCIIRIMKARKSLDHLALFNETVKMLQNCFLPEPKLIKRRIERLIDTQYLERDLTN